VEVDDAAVESAFLQQFQLRPETFGKGLRGRRTAARSNSRSIRVRAVDGAASVFE
jgi:hypothetical protein